MEAKLSKFILMMPKTQVKKVLRIKESFNQSKFQESKSHSIKASFKNQDSIKIKIKTQDLRIKRRLNQDKY